MMLKRRTKNRLSLLGGVTSGIGTLLGTTVAAAGGWIVYSNIAIDHQLPLSKAIDADISTISSENVGQVNIYSDRSASGRPLVLIHSINAAASSYEMGPIFNRYRATRPVFAIDLPGFGFSERSERLYTPRLYQEAILEVLQAQVTEPADVVALSLGCEFAARAAAIEPERFNSLIFISPTGLGEKALKRSMQPERTEQRADGLHQAFALPLWGRPLYDLIATRRSIRYFLEKSYVGPVPEDMIAYAYATAHQPGAEHAPLYFISGKLFTPGVTPAFYERLELPILVIYDQDAYTGFDLLPEIIQAHNNWKAVRIQPTRGLPQFEQMDAVSDALDTFWTSASM
ncbi:MAG: alpha/beta hydrolase [Anaerolineaceae bacterium]|nr:alpha/beta hydrolase [Anaerolineaceae bacterium]